MTLIDKLTTLLALLGDVATAAASVQTALSSLNSFLDAA
jgi:hypothetical protein